MRGIAFSVREKEWALRMWLTEHKDVYKVARKLRCSADTIRRWRRLWDGTRESLQNKSHRPHTPHPNAHTEEEQGYIKELFEARPDITYAEAFGILREERAYSRTYYGFYRYVVKSGIRPKEIVERYVPQKYYTPEMFGLKMQMDVKFVPRPCYQGAALEALRHNGTRYYQYTMIDEATRERFIFPYPELSAVTTRNFIQRAIIYFGYIPDTIQTDNGGEFTNPRGKCHKIHAADELMQELNIRHKLIPPYTPRHNGKVERSHRSDQENFYDHTTFETYEELLEKMKAWNGRYNRRPHSSLRNKDGKRVWYSPLQKRAELMEILMEAQADPQEDTPQVRFLKFA